MVTKLSGGPAKNLMLISAQGCSHSTFLVACSDAQSLECHHQSGKFLILTGMPAYLMVLSNTSFPSVLCEYHG